MTNVVKLHAWKGKLSKDDKGRVVKSMTNLMAYVRNVIGDDIRYNILGDRIEYRGQPLKPSDITTFRLEFEGMTPSFSPPKDDIPAAIEAVAHENAYHPIREYLESLPAWDNVNRLSMMFPSIFHSDDTPYTQAIGLRYMIGAVARIMKPGCKMDNMLVLEGPQNAGKGEALTILFTESYYTVMTGVLRDQRRFVEQILGNWCVEFAEFASLNEANIDLVKALCTVKVDRITRNYSRVGATDHPRQTVLAATINPTPGCGYLKDPTGNRRFWPVKCDNINLSRLARQRDLFWAEALHRYRSGEQWHLTDEEYELASTEQEMRQETDVWEGHLRAMDRNAKLTSSDILYQYLSIERGRQSSGDARRLAIVMRKIGWVEAKIMKKQEDGADRQARGWKFGTENDASYDG